MEIEEALIAHYSMYEVDLKVWADAESWNEKIALNSLVGRRIFRKIYRRIRLPAISIIKIPTKDHT